MRWLAWVLAGLAAAPAGLAAYLRRQGDADVRCEAGAVEVLGIQRRPGCWLVRFRLPMVNRGRQKGMLYEILIRPEFLGRWAAPLRWSVALFWPGVQETGYWSAALLKPGQAVPLEVELAAFGPDDVIDRLSDLEELVLVVRHGCIGRTPLRWALTEVRLPLAKARPVAAAPARLERGPTAGGRAFAARPPAVTVTGRSAAAGRTGRPGGRAAGRRRLPAARGHEGRGRP